MGNMHLSFCNSPVSSVPMKKRVVLLSVATCILFALACKKDANNSSAFSPIGFWRGNLVENEASIAMFNRPDGTSSFYAMLTSLDTTIAEEKFYGHYTMQNGMLKAILAAPVHQGGLIYDSLTLETVTANVQSMTGIIIINEKIDSVTTGVLTPTFILVKQ